MDSLLRYHVGGRAECLTYSVPLGLSDASLSAMYDAYDSGVAWSLCGAEFFPPGPCPMLDLGDAADLHIYNLDCVRAIRDHLKAYIRESTDQRGKACYLSAVVALGDFERILERVTP